jgi:hypothetical protein
MRLRGLLLATDDWRGVEPEFARLFLFLNAIRAVWAGCACLTDEGRLYLGVDSLLPAPPVYR